MLRQMTMTHPDKLLPGWETQHKPQPVYVEVSAAGQLLFRYLALTPSKSVAGSLLPARPDGGVRMQGYGFVPPSQVRPFTENFWSGWHTHRASEKGSRKCSHEGRSAALL